MVHDASFGRGNVDHILIGPGGVFTVETKSHPGPIRVGRLHGSVLGQAQAQRKAVEGIVDEHVEPLVVFSRAWVDRPLSRRKGVRVVPARMLTGYVERQPQRLDEQAVERAHARLAQALAAVPRAHASRAPAPAPGRRAAGAAVERQPPTRREAGRAAAVESRGEMASAATTLPAIGAAEEHLAAPGAAVAARWRRRWRGRCRCRGCSTAAASATGRCSRCASSPAGGGSSW